MRDVEPPGFHIAVWREGSDALMVLSGTAGQESQSDVAQAFSPYICLPEGRLTLDLQEVGLSGHAAQSLIQGLMSIGESGGSSYISSINNEARMVLTGLQSSQVLPLTSTIPSRRWDRHREKIWWQMHSYILPSAGWASAFAREKVVELTSAMGLAQREIDGIRMAVGEAACNAVRHGRAYHSPGSIKFRYTAGLGALEILVSDGGDGFDLGTVHLRRAKAIGLGGHGIDIMHGTMDEVEFCFDGGTHVRMVKRLK